MSHNHFDLTIDALEVEAAKKEAEAAELRRTANSLRALRSGESIVPTQKLLPAPAETDASGGSKKKTGIPNCIIGNCKGPGLRQGLCHKHYGRYRYWLRTGKVKTLEAFTNQQMD